MNEIKTKIKIVEGRVYYEIFVDTKQHSGTYVFENWLSNILKLQDELQFKRGDKLNLMEEKNGRRK